MKEYKMMVIDSKGNLVDRPKERKKKELKKVVPIITGTTGTKK
jgi:hypothetical protein